MSRFRIIGGGALGFSKVEFVMIVKVALDWRITKLLTIFNLYSGSTDYHNISNHQLRSIYSGAQLDPNYWIDALQDSLAVNGTEIDIIHNTTSYRTEKSVCVSYNIFRSRINFYTAIFDKWHTVWNSCLVYHGNLTYRFKSCFGEAPISIDGDYRAISLFSLW